MGKINPQQLLVQLRLTSWPFLLEAFKTWIMHYYWALQYLQSADTLVLMCQPPHAHEPTSLINSTSCSSIQPSGSAS